MHFLLAVILTELEDYRNAKGAYKKALKMDPNLLVGRVNFSIFELRRNNIADAIKRLGTLSADELSAPSVGELNEMVFRLRKTFMAIAEIQNKDS